MNSVCDLLWKLVAAEAPQLLSEGLQFFYARDGLILTQNLDLDYLLLSNH
jgi:hypothetical protein